METTLLIVIGAAFLTAVMTGAGALPFVFVNKLGARTVGWSNAAAAGLMLDAGALSSPVKLSAGKKRHALIQMG